MEPVSRSQSYRKSLEGAELICANLVINYEKRVHRGFLQRILRNILLEDQTLISLTCKSIHNFEVKQ